MAVASRMRVPYVGETHFVLFGADALMVEQQKETPKIKTRASQK